MKENETRSRRYFTKPELIGKLEKYGYWLYRENFPWGKQDAYKNEHNDILFIWWSYGNGYISVTPGEMLNLLNKYWRPVAKSEVTWKLDEMESYFSGELKGN